MVEIIKDNIYNIAAIAAFVSILVVLYKKGRSENVKRIILNLVIKAEANFGKGTGEIKYNEIVSGIYKVLPSIVLLFLTEKDLDNMIEEAVKHMKELLKENKNIVNKECEVILIKEDDKDE